MSDLNELYQEIILDHNKHPRNCRSLGDANHHAEGYNPLCGDKVTIYIKVKDGMIDEISFEGSGCAISTASASLMTEALKGKSLEQAARMFESFHGVVTGKPGAVLQENDSLKLAVFHGVSDYPIRVKCATLPWHTLQAALANKVDQVTTE
jgi:nitrogen fixation NifU-like protein